MKIRKGTMKTPADDDMVTLTTMGNILEIRYKSRETTPSIKKLDKDHFIDLRTGEYREFNHNTTRSQDMGSVAQSLKRLREIINTNTTNKNALFCTLTFAENMTDHVRLYEEFRRFNQRLKTYHQQNKLPQYEYIVAAEPQARGAWHMHLLLIYISHAPFIPNDDLAKVWRHGFTKVTSLKNVDNVGAYLSAYLGDMKMEETDILSRNVNVKEITEIDSDGNKNSKYFVKGARLKLYPKGFRLYRSSQGIMRPTVMEMPYSKALQAIGNAPLTYESTIELLDNNGIVFNIISYKQYNRALCLNKRQGTG